MTALDSITSASQPSMQSLPELNAVKLLETISQTLSSYITESNPWVLFNGLLDDLLSLTGSEYGFIGEVFYHQGQPYIRSYATTNIAWSAETRQLYKETADKGMLFSKLDSLYGEVLKTARPVISNNPADDTRSGGLPKGHPPLNSFLGLPFYCGQELQGVVGIANRSTGYEQSLVDYLAPFLSTCSNLIRAYRNNVKRLQIEDELQSYKRRLAAMVRQRSQDSIESEVTAITLNQQYDYQTDQQCLYFNRERVNLTRKESLLFSLLASNLNQVVEHRTIEQHIWAEVIVSESSLRALVRRLRKKLPGLTIRTVSGIGYLLALD